MKGMKKIYNFNLSCKQRIKILKYLAKLYLDVDEIISVFYSNSLNRLRLIKGD